MMGNRDRRIRFSLSEDGIQRFFRVMEYLLFKAGLFVLAAIGVYHLVARG